MRTQEESSEQLWIELDGDLQGAEALTLGERLPLSKVARAKRVVLSFGNVRRIDEAGLAMLVRLYSHLRVRGGQLELVEVPADISALLARVGISRLISQADRSGTERVPASA